MRTISRRGFLRQVAFTGASPEGPPQTLVWVFLRGGADTLNLVVPCGDDNYYKLRPTISVPPPARRGADKQAALPLDDFYGLHPLLEPLLPIYHSGRLGIVQGVGSDNPTGSHFDAQDQIEHGEAYGRTIGGGWLGRHLRLRGGALSAPLAAVALGPTLPESLRGAPAASAIASLDEVQMQTPSGNSRAASRALAALYGPGTGVISRPGQAALDLLQRVEALRGKEYKPENGADYASDPFSAGLREVARMVKAEVGLEAACIDLGGWDTHFFQGVTAGAQAESISQLARGLAAFDADLAKYQDRVTTIVMTEFGRRIYENGSLGTDHGRGYALVALGGRIAGGRIHGSWPGLEEEEVSGPGGLKLNYDYRSVLSEALVGLMGNREIDKVFPGFRPERVGIVKGL